MILRLRSQLPLQDCKTVAAYCLRRVIAERRCGRSRARAEQKAERGIEIELLDEIERRLKVLVRLSWVADNKVRREADLWSNGSQRRDLGLVFDHGMPTLHTREHSIRATLHGQVQVIDELRDIAIGIDQVRVEFERMRGGEANARNAFDLSDVVEQFGEVCCIAFDWAAIGIDVLTEQRHFTNAARRKSANFVEHILDRPAHLKPARIGHHAKAAELATAFHDGDKRRRAAHAGRRQTVELINKRKADINDWSSVLCACLIDHVRQLVQRLRAEHQVHERRTRVNLGTFLASNAAADADEEFRVGFLQRPPPANSAKHLFLSLLSNRAGVDNQEVGLRRVVGVLEAVACAQGIAHTIRIVFVHLAPLGNDVEARRQVKCASSAVRWAIIDSLPQGFAWFSQTPRLAVCLHGGCFFRQASAMTNSHIAILNALLSNRLHNAKDRRRHLNERPRTVRASKETEQVIRACERLGLHMLTIDDARFPARLAEIPDPPLLLFVQGSIQSLSADSLAIVGGREASGAGQRFATMVAQQLSDAGLAIVSGLALGIDTAAHIGALKGASPTIAVLGSGHERLYPARNISLAHTIVQQGGAIVSEYPPHFGPTRYRFPERNRIVSGLALGTLVIEARAKSGSLITASYALEQGREVMAVPGPVSSHLSRGGHALIRDGAALIENAEDVLSALGFSRDVRQEETSAEKLDPTEQRVLDALDFTGTAFDVVVKRTGLSTEALLQSLLNLELAGFVENGARGYIRASTH